MDIYVQSRGKKELKHGYRWINKFSKKDEPSIITSSFSFSNTNEKEFYLRDFHNNESPVILLLRDKNQLWFLLTGIKAEWTTVSGGVIYHSIAWLSNDSNLIEENQLRKLLIYSLKENLQEKLHSIITSSPDSELGFQVNFGNLEFKNLEKLITDSPLEISNDPSIVEEGKCYDNTPENKNLFVEEFTKNSLPKEDGFLIVVSDFVSLSRFKKAKVWRGLSKKIESEDGETYPIKKNLIQNDENPTLPDQATQSLSETQMKSEVPNTVPVSKTNIWEQITQNRPAIFLIGLVIGILIGILVTQIYIEKTGKTIFPSHLNPTQDLQIIH